MNVLTQAVYRLKNEERGTSTLEWSGLTVTIAILMIAVVGYIDTVNGGPIGRAISDQLSSMIISYEGGGSVPGYSPGAGASAPTAAVPSVTISNADVPTVSVPQIVAPSISIPLVTVQGYDVSGIGQDDGGGGFWSWVGNAWSGFTDWVGDRWSDVANFWEGLPSWVKGIAIGIVAGVVVVAAAFALVAAGVIAGVSAVAIAATIVVAAAVGGIYGLIAGDGFNGWTAFGLSLLGGALAMVAVSSGAVAAAWAWTAEVGWPAVMAFGRTLLTRLGGLLQSGLAAGRTLISRLGGVLQSGLAAGRSLAIRLGGLLKGGLATLWKSIVANKSRLLANYLAYVLAKVVILDAFIGGELPTWSKIDDYLLDLGFITLGVLWTPAFIAKLSGRLKLAAELAWGAVFAGTVTIIKEIRENGLRLDKWDWSAIAIAAGVGALFKKFKIGTWGKPMTDFVKRMITTPLKKALNWVADQLGFGDDSGSTTTPPITPTTPPATPPTPPPATPPTSPASTLAPPVPPVVPPPVAPPPVVPPPVVPPTVPPVP